MKVIRENFTETENEPNKKSYRLFWLFKKKYSTRYNTEVWVFNPFALLGSRGKLFIQK